MFLCIEIKWSENNQIMYLYCTYDGSVNCFFLYYWIVSLNIFDTDGRSDGQQSGVFTLNGNPMAFALYYWKKGKDRQREKEGEEAATHQNWPTYILLFSLACADLQFAFTVQRSALLCWSWEQTKQQRRRRFVRSHFSRVHRCCSFIDQYTKKK